MQQLQDEYGEDGLVVLYYHVSDGYSTAETHNRPGLSVWVGHDGSFTASVGLDFDPDSGPGRIVFRAER